MDKLHMREYVAELETRIDRALKLWKKLVHHENGETVQLEWQFEQCRVFLEVLWEDGTEAIELTMKAPRRTEDEKFSLLNRRTAAEIMDRIGNFAMKVQHPKPRPSE